VGATLGEIRDRADVVVFDGRNPPAALPRFAERFLDPPGRLVPDGRAGRTVIWLGDADAETITRAVGAAPDLIMRIDRPAGFAALRAILRGAEITEGVETEALRNLAARLQAARYGVLVLGGPPGDGPGEVEEALKLVRDLNRSTRFVAIHPAASGENTPGAAMVTAWQAGVATALDLALGYPRQLPGEGAAYRIARREIDAVLDLKGVDEIAALGAIRTIRVGRDAAPGVCSVAIPTGRPGIEEDGTVARFDGVMLPLRAPLASSTRRLRQVDVLEAILDGLRSARGASR
jgi:formylmethanofuran dehydrogenase subunit B